MLTIEQRKNPSVVTIQLLSDFLVELGTNHRVSKTGCVFEIKPEDCFTRVAIYSIMHHHNCNVLSIDRRFDIYGNACMDIVTDMTEETYTSITKNAQKE